MQHVLPEHVSYLEYVIQAEKWLHIAGKELAKKPVMDAHELFLDELKEYFERKHERELGEVVFERGKLKG